MNKFIIIFVVANYFTSPSESACSTDSFTPVKIVDVTGVLGRWFTTSRFSNGNDQSICLWEEFTMVPNPRNAINEVLNRLYKNGTNGYKKCQQTSIITIVDPNKKPPDAILDVRYNTGVEQIKYITGGDPDNNEYALVRACYKGEEYYWTYTRNQYPSDETLAKISKAQDEQGVDKSKITSASCSKVPASKIV